MVNPKVILFLHKEPTYGNPFDQLRPINMVAAVFRPGYSPSEVLSAGTLQDSRRTRNKVNKPGSINLLLES